MAEIATKMETGVPASSWGIGFLAWLVPGAGHLVQGFWVRGLLLGGAVWSLIIIGLSYLGGHLHYIPKSGAGLLWHLFGLCNLGTGLFYLACWMLGTGFTEYAERATFEYGKIFLVVAGLLNCLAMLDAFDIATRRKP